MSTVNELAEVWTSVLTKIDNVSARNSIGRVLLNEMRQIMCPPIIKSPKHNDHSLYLVLNSDYVRNSLIEFTSNREKIGAIKWLRQYLSDNYAYSCGLALAKQWVEYVWGEHVQPFVTDIKLTKLEKLPF